MKIINNENYIIKVNKFYKKRIKEENIVKEKIEEIFIKILLKNIRLTTPKNKLFNEEKNEIYNEIYDQKISEILSKKGINLINNNTNMLQNKKYDI
ncbi:flagellar biosynthesis protein FlgJ [Buchnera aphidicola]|uniref:flagellar biosynthesis protein FlgJ n=1 Tax=Buchnera aphidicola TaxID=9 RepID=UPI0031B844B8